MDNTVEKKAGIKDLMVCKSYMTLLLAKTISRFGDSIDSIAYEWMVYMLTGSKLIMGTLLAVNALPNVLFSAFTGVFVDYLPKKKLVVLGYLGRGVIVCLVALLYLTESLRPWHLFIFTFLTSTFETISSPAEQSILPSVLPKHLFLTAGSFSNSASTFAQLIGLGAAGFIIALLGISGAIFIDGLTFFAAAVLTGIIRLEDDKSTMGELTPARYFKDLKEGFAFVKRHSLIFTTIIFAAFINFCLGPMNVLQPVFVKDILKSGPEAMSYIGVGLMAGMILGGLIVGQFASRIKTSTLLVSGFFLFGVSYALLSIPGTVYIPFISPLVLAVIIFFILGFSTASVNAPMGAYILTNTPKELLGRISSLMGMVCLCAIPAGNSLTGIVSEYVSPPVLFLAMGIIITIATLPLLFNKGFRNEENRGAKEQAQVQ